MKPRLYTMLLTAGLCVAGCTVGPNYHQPKMNMPGAFVATSQPVASTTQPVELARWWESLHDEELNSLIQRAVAANPNLRIAADRLEEARAIEAVFTGTSLPDAEFSLGAGRGSGTNSTKGRISGPLNAASNTTGLKQITQVIGFDAAWEIDLFGNLRRQAEATIADTRAAVDFYDQALVTLTADVARSYVELRTLQERIVETEEAIEVQRKSLDFAQGQFQHGLASKMNAVLAQRELEAVSADLEPLEAQLAASKRALAVLLGEFPQDMEAELDATAPPPQPPASAPNGIPADLLRRRPDICQAEHQLIAANARIGVATANLYPQIFLTGGGGWQGQGLGVTPVRWDSIWSVGPAVKWAVFDFGTLDAAITVEDFHTREMLWAYRNTVINAVREVDDAMQNYAAQRQRSSDLTQAVAAAKDAAALAMQGYKAGFTDFLNVLDAQRQLLSLEDQLATAENETADQFIAVCKSLGGGWEGYGLPPPLPALRPALIAAGADALGRSSGPLDIYGKH